MIAYRVDIDDAHTHHWRVTLTVPHASGEQELAMPVWIPGSYLVRDFARHLSALMATQGRRALAIEPLDTSRWRVRCVGRGALVLRYRVYAFDRSLRGAFLDARRGFFNGSSLCLRVVGREAEPHRLSLGRLPAGWEVATAMPASADGAWEAADYDELIDHPFELGSFWRGRFDAGGVPHEVVVSAALPRLDGKRLLSDLRRICLRQIDFWHGHDGSSPPFDRYVFLLRAAEEGCDGLEHRASTALQVARRDLPTPDLPADMAAGRSAISDGHALLLTLASHEYFHAWNVKRLKPAALSRMDLQRENDTQLLWFFEGFTSYYEGLLLLRAGLIDVPRWLAQLARTVQAVANAPGRQVQSLAEASADAWIKLYRQDENSANATVNYYQKGALVALAFDLTLRSAGGSLDKVMRLLWQRSAAAHGDGALTEADIAAALGEVAGRPLDAEMAAWVHGRAELPLAELLAGVGVELVLVPAGWAASLGLRLSEGASTGVQVKAVLVGSAAATAGVAAGDELLAVDGWRIRRLDDARAWVGREQPFELLLARDQQVTTLRVRPQPDSALAHTVELQLSAGAARPVLARRRAWLQG